MLLPRTVACVWLTIATVGRWPPPTAAAAFHASQQFSDRAKSMSDMAIGIARRFPGALPKPADVFSASKNLLAGYPVEALLSAIDLICSMAMSNRSVQPKASPDIVRMNFVLMTPDKNYSIGLREAHRLWHHAAFNQSRPTVVMVTGWTSNVNKTNTAMNVMYDAYKCRGGVNFLGIDTADYVDTLYEWAAFNTEALGKLLGIAIANLTDTYPIEHVHLIGHSLGAHIVGSAGRAYHELTGLLLPRITGLDPANPCFNEGEMLGGIARGDAQFVDIIHSNPGALGKRDALGDVDFYPNGKMDPLPEGCYNISCAHSRAYEYYAESVYPGNENAFLGVRCQSMFALKVGFCKGQPQPMGYATPSKLKGEYFLKTQTQNPYGEYSTDPSMVECSMDEG